MLKIYSIPECSACQKTKKYLTMNNIEYTDINVEEDIAGRNEMLKISNQNTVPVIIIDDKMIIGFDKDAIDSALNLE